jgi:hypothetical protein
MQIRLTVVGPRKILNRCMPSIRTRVTATDRNHSPDVGRSRCPCNLCSPRAPTNPDYRAHYLFFPSILTNLPQTLLVSPSKKFTGYFLKVHLLTRHSRRCNEQGAREGTPMSQTYFKYLTL